MGLPRRSTSSSLLIFSLASAEEDQLRKRTAGLIDRLAQADLSDTCRTTAIEGIAGRLLAAGILASAGAAFAFCHVIALGAT
jgi:hypothetical protein